MAIGHYEINPEEYQRLLQENEQMKRDIIQFAILAYTPEVSNYMPYGMKEKLIAYNRGNLPAVKGEL